MVYRPIVGSVAGVLIASQEKTIDVLEIEPPFIDAAHCTSHAPSLNYAPPPCKAKAA